MKRVVAIIMLCAEASFGAAFTAVTAGTDWQDVDFINEIIVSYQERRKVVGATPDLGDSGIAIGTDLQGRTGSLEWRSIQAWIEDTADNGVWVDHTVNGFADSNTASVTTFTNLVNWRSDVGLNTNGFRRAAVWDPSTNDWTDFSDDMYTTNLVGGIQYAGGFGLMEVGDIIGPWVFDDLQGHLSELKWTKTTYVIDNREDWGLGTESAYSNDCASSQSAYISEWNATNWVGGSAADYFSYGYGLRTYSAADGGKWKWWGQLGRGDADFSVAYTGIAHTVDMYVWPEALPGTTFNDMYGFGIVEDTVFLWTTIASSQSASHTVTGPTNTECPVSFLSCDTSTESIGYRILDNEGLNIIKWTFSYSN